MAQTSNNNYLNNPFALGLFRASLMFPIEHFVDMTKVASQKSPDISSLKVIKKIYTEKGFKGFVEGAGSNFPRRVLRDSVRWPIIGYTHKLLTQNFPQIFSEKSTLSSVFSGIAGATFDSLVLGPFELLMAYRLKEGKKYRDFAQKQFRQEGIASLYRGASLNFTYRCAVWSVYMGVNSEIIKLFNVIDKKKLPPYSKEVTAAVAISTSLVSILLPVDFVKTQIQMNPELQRKKITHVVSMLLNKYRFSRFYAGASIVWSYNIAYSLAFQKVLERTMIYFKDSKAVSK